MVAKNLIRTSLIGLTMMSTQAFADDWSGLYLGGNIGYSFFSTEHKLLEVSTFTERPTSVNQLSSEPSGFSGGVQVGYQKQFGPFVAGVEASYTALDVDDFGRTNLNNGTSTATGEISDLFAVTARGGVAIDNMLAYGKIGYANAGVGYDNVLNSTGETLLNTDERESGLVLGAGVEFAVTKNVSVGVDYTYVNFDIDARIQDMDVDALRSAIDQKTDSDIHQVGVRLNFRLN